MQMVLDQVEDLELDLPGDLVDDHPAVVADGGQRPGVGRRPRSRVSAGASKPAASSPPPPSSSPSPG